jgi:hypothetical protein
MTTLYMATKIFGARQISISSLAELSRGEFEASHIAEMEVMILQTLRWRVHPPTGQCFVDAFHAVLPLSEGSVSDAIYQRAIFFTELALYDYTFVPRDRALIAVAALMNSMEGIDEAAAPKKYNSSLTDAIQTAFGLSFPAAVVEAARNRLWYVYSMSAQHQEEDVLAPHSTREINSKEVNGCEASSSVPGSPVCVGIA